MFGAGGHAMAAEAMEKARGAEEDLVGDTVDTSLEQSGRREAPIPHYPCEYQVVRLALGSEGASGHLFPSTPPPFLSEKIHQLAFL